MALKNPLTNSRNRSVARDERSGSRDIGPSVKPLYEVKETEEAFGVITAEAGEFRIVGQRAWKQPEGWTAIYRESSDLPFELTLAHDNAINADDIAAELRDGVLRVSLPKAEELKPRKIAVS